MRTLLLLRGSPGCGKSTWIKRNGLKPYTLSADDIRLLCQSPILNVNGGKEINQKNDTVTWNVLFKLLETRMQNGEFTVIDATNSKTSEMNRYKQLCDSYKYRIFCVDFTDIPINVAKERNAQRETLKIVPDEVIEKMYSRFSTQKIPSGITVIKPDELDKVFIKKFNMNGYNKIHCIGDIHGCNTVLQYYLEDGLKDDEFYIFTGDYIDRGIENVETLKFLLSIYTNKNVLLLEGNHERALWVWANGGTTHSKEFEIHTRTELERCKEISTKDIRMFYRKLGQCAYFDFGENTYLITHAGLSTIPDENLITVSTNQMIKGVGNYDDVESVANTFISTTPNNYYQIHGHRNTKSLPVQVNERVFNLEGQVEFGGNLRCVQILPSGEHIAFETPNPVFRIPEELKTFAKEEAQEKTLDDVIISLRNNRYIQEKVFGNFSSFNFTKNAFYEKVWDDQTVKARGLYIDIPKTKVVARAYEKFFNINERPETKFEMLQHKLKFPVTAYVKENGFLGIVGYDEYNNDLFITTKSNPEGDYAVWFKNLLYRSVSRDKIEELKQYIKENDVSFVFECVDMVHDPHIIDYPDSRVVLLDIVRNQIEFSKFTYEEMRGVANRFGFRHKQKAFILSNWQDFFDWYYEVTNENYEYQGSPIEGFVIEDSSGYMVKLKLQYYNFWKFMRSIAHETIRKGYTSKTSALTSPTANHFYGWVKNLAEITEDKETIPKDICSLRNMFYAETK